MKYPLHGDEKKWPEEGEEIIFTAHVKNKGRSDFKGGFQYRWLFNHKEVDGGAYDGGLKMGEEATFSLKWKWSGGHGDHRDEAVAFWVDPEERAVETPRNNNYLSKYVKGRTLMYWVEESLYRFANGVINAWGSESFEDYLQWHMWIWNETFLDKSRFKEIAVDGCLERVSLDGVAVVSDGILDPWGKHTPKASRESPPGTGLADVAFDGEWGSAWFHDREAEGYEGRIEELKEFISCHGVVLEGSLLHEASHQVLGAFDIYWSNMEPSLPSDPCGKVKVKGGGKRYITQGEMYPFAGLMGGGDTRPDETYWRGTGLYSLHSVAGFNSNLPYRAGFFGEWQYDLPGKIKLRILDAAGEPLAGAGVTLWQAAANSIRDENLVKDGLKTDGMGLVALPGQPSVEKSDITVATGHTLLKNNPFGRISVVGTNTTLLVRVEAFGQRDHRFVRIVDLNRGFWKGFKEEYIHPLKTGIVPSASVQWNENVAQGCRVYATSGQENAHLAVDGRTGTAWEGGRVERGDYFQIELGSALRVAAVSLVQRDEHGAFFPRFKIEVSQDPAFEKEIQLFAQQVPTDFSYAMYCQRKINPEDPNERWVDYTYCPTKAQCVRITALEKGWAKMHEIRIFAVR